MSGLLSPSLLCKYFKVLEEGCTKSDDFDWLEETLDGHPELARKRLPNGELPMRMQLEREKPPGIFGLLAQHGAEHDIITASAATDLKAVKLILHQAMRDACEKGYRWFDFNPSGGHQGVARFKSYFGAQPLSCPVIRRSSKIMTSLQQAGRAVRRGLRPLHHAETIVTIL